ncbi:DUF3426 domain-containing protein [Ramlibacter tataouinensis]|uniref:DUF3426 domain-containing protein n=1 Tax=Ramlibacter tataouinensis TaxID=94132 RepID=UPI0022F3B335|nr:DUF3426 domain-containing protein [Ramlibacter tataouinensis]WBY00816.1 DUF3426 domain-containing protein [Ramlibacter tataouinensis]
MSMITGCPACGTMFRVVPDQLKISEGWVRCGRCGEVFDATESLQAEDRRAAPAPEPAAEPAPEPAAAPVAEEVPDIGPVSVATLLAAPVSESPLHEPDDPAPRPHATEVDFEPGPDAEPAIDSPGLSDAPADMAMAAELPGSPSAQAWDSQPAAIASGFDEWQAMREQAEDDRSFEAQDSTRGDSGLEEVSFVRQAQRRAFWRRPLVRLALLLAVLALAGMLALQFAVRERDRLALAQPQLRPLLERVCGQLGCSIGAPRRIEAIVIDNSGFTRLRPDVYRLSFTLKNQSALPVAVPALQLTLTDGGEQAVVQRVLLPRELGAAPATIGAAAEWSASVALGVDAGNGDAARIAGYRLLAFYP